MLDIFNNDAFSVVRLTDSLRDLKFIPGRIGQMGLFTKRPVDTLSIAIERIGDALNYVPPTPRGSPGQTIQKQRANIRNLTIPHFQRDDAIYADEVQGVRAFGSETALQTIQMKVGDRMQTHSQDLAATEEHARFGAIKGIVVYSDNVTTLNLFNEFGVSQEATIPFDLAAGSPTMGALRKKFQTEVIRKMADLMEGVPYSGVYAFCGNTFFDNLVTHKEIRETYLNQVGADELRQGYLDPTSGSYGKFNFAGITFENYRGSIGGTPFVADNEVHFFPIGSPGLFTSYYAPADYIETVNTMGRERYAKMYPEPNGKAQNMEVQTNVLSICKRPRALLKGTGAAS